MEVTMLAWGMFLRKPRVVQGRRPWESQRILCARVRAPSYLRHRAVLPSTFSCMFFLCGGPEMLGTWLVVFVKYPVRGALLVSAPPISPTSELRSSCCGRDAPVLYSMNSYWHQIRLITPGAAGSLVNFSSLKRAVDQALFPAVRASRGEAAGGWPESIFRASFACSVRVCQVHRNTCLKIIGSPGQMGARGYEAVRRAPQRGGGRPAQR